MSSLKKFIYRFAWPFTTVLSLLCVAQFGVILFKNEYIKSLVEENNRLTFALENTEKQIDKIIALQRDTRVFQQQIDSWFKGAKNSFAHFSNFVNNPQFASRNVDILASGDRLATLEFNAHQDHFAASSLLEKTLALKDFLLKVPSISPATGYISSHFGTRFDPSKRRMSYHRGIDIAGPIGDPIKASAQGKVVTATKSKSFGNLVEIEHAYGYVTRYAHLHRVYVKKGEHVAQGQSIGSRGNSGRSRGPHLHYEVHKDNKSLDPSQFMISSSQKFF
jgi:murein DD-endopeptidase MepM/ murein hydrolase activator NlpD